MQRNTISGLILCAGMCFGTVSIAEQPDLIHGRVAGEGQVWTTAVEPKAITPNVSKGLAWLIAAQHENGGWGQGDEAAGMGGGRQVHDKANVADTCIATLALLRANNGPTNGTHDDAIRRAIGFVCTEVENSDEESLYVTSVRGTRVQSKIGTYIDTFMASITLSEVKGRTGDDASDARVDAALGKVLAKIARHQDENGKFKNQGWAPVLGQAMAAKGLNRAAQSGVRVAGEVLDRAQAYAEDQFDEESGRFDRDGAAGVELYAAASSFGALSDDLNTKELREDDLRQIVEESKDEKEVARAEGELVEIQDARRSRKAACDAVMTRVDDEGFIAGFGSNGGEEFLSYLNISEALVVGADEQWRDWDVSMTRNLSRVQNPDGSWTGHHCITGRTFCTGSALLVLLADRTPVPVESIDDNEEE